MYLLLDRRYRLPRVWSNRELRKIAPLCTGRVINVSGWEDRDKEGGFYRDYFVNAQEYTVSNYDGYRGFQGLNGEVQLDLSSPLPVELKKNFDVVFNHTTLEHIFDVNTAIHNLCDLSTDLVIVVVPVAQPQHESESWKDYWRFTPTCIREYFHREGMTVLYEAVNRNLNSGIYLLTVATHIPDKWKDKFTEVEAISDAARELGRGATSYLFDSIRRVIRRLSPKN